MANWVVHSLIKGIRSEPGFERGQPPPAGATPGRPLSQALAKVDAKRLAALCPSGAITAGEAGMEVEFTHCVQCQRCRQNPGDPVWRDDVRWGAWRGVAAPLAGRFRRSLHVRYLDAGACGACMGEVRLIDAPPYNLHRYGIFITATPRDADVLLVAGPVSEAMRLPLRKAYEAMPEPKRVVAMGVCAIDGGVFGRSFATVGGVNEVLPVDLVIAGCPPPPLAIVHGLLLVAGRLPAAADGEGPGS